MVFSTKIIQISKSIFYRHFQMKCLMSGSKLVEIETKAENDFLTTTLPNFKAGGLISCQILNNGLT